MIKYIYSNLKHKELPLVQRLNSIYIINNSEIYFILKLFPILLTSQ